MYEYMYCMWYWGETYGKSDHCECNNGLCALTQANNRGVKISFIICTQAFNSFLFNKMFNIYQKLKIELMQRS